MTCRQAPTPIAYTRCVVSYDSAVYVRSPNPVSAILRRWRSTATQGQILDPTVRGAAQQAVERTFQASKTAGDVAGGVCVGGQSGG